MFQGIEAHLPKTSIMTRRFSEGSSLLNQEDVNHLPGNPSCKLIRGRNLKNTINSLQQFAPIDRERKIETYQNNEGPMPVRESKDSSYAILVAIVLMFIVSHSFRLAFKSYEVLFPGENTSENYDRCFMIGR